MKSKKFILFCAVGVGQFLEFSISISKKERKGRKKKKARWTKDRRTYFLSFK